MHARPLEKTLVCQLSPGRGRGRWLATTFPKSAMMILRAFKGDYRAWEDAGRLSRLVSSRRKTPGSRKIGSMNRITIPPPVIRRMRLSDKKLLQWYVTAGPGDKWEILAGVEKPAVPGRARMPKRRSGLFSRGVATTATRLYGIRNGRAKRITTSIPPASTSVIGMEKYTHAAWRPAGRVFILVPMRGTARGAIAINFKDDWRTIYIPKHLHHRLHSCRETLPNWYIASNGKGSWQVHTRPVMA